MVSDPTHRCPACGEAFGPKVEPEYNLPPTGGDYEYCDGQQRIPCPHCERELIARVRTWLDQRGTECLSLEVAPEPPHPFCSAVELAISPDARYLAVRPLGGEPWMMELGDDPRALRLPEERWPLCFSQDGARVFSRGGPEVFRLQDGLSAGATPWPFIRTWDDEPSQDPTDERSQSEIRAAAFVGANHLAIDSSSVLEGHATHLDLIALDGSAEPFGLLSHRGSGNMDGAAFFAPDGARTLHVCATSHGAARFILSLFALDPEAEQPIRLLARAEHEGLDLQRVCWLEDGSILAAFDPRCWGRMHTETPYGMALLDGDDLSVLKRTEDLKLPRPEDEVPPAFFMPADIKALALAQEGAYLLGTDQIYLILETEEGFVCEQLFDTGSPQPFDTVAFHGPSLQAAICRDEEIYWLNMGEQWIEAVGRKLSAALAPSG